MCSVFEPFDLTGIMSCNKTLDMWSFIIVTLALTANIAEIHNRMPVILRDDTMSAWMDLQTGSGDALDLLLANRGSDLVSHPVTKNVGNVNNMESRLKSRFG